MLSRSSHPVKGSNGTKAGIGGGGGCGVSAKRPKRIVERETEPRPKGRKKRSPLQEWSDGNDACCPRKFQTNGA